MCFQFPSITCSEPVLYNWKSSKHKSNKAPCLRHSTHNWNSFTLLNNPRGIHDKTWRKKAVIPRRVPFPASLAEWAQIRLSKVGHWAQKGLCLICAPRRSHAQHRLFDHLSDWVLREHCDSSSSHLITSTISSSEARNTSYERGNADLNAWLTHLRCTAGCLANFNHVSLLDCLQTDYHDNTLTKQLT